MGLSQVDLRYPLTQVTEHQHRFDRYFLHNQVEGIDYYQLAMRSAEAALVEQYATNEKPYSGLAPTKFVHIFDDTFDEMLPEEGASIENLLKKVGETIVAHSIQVANPRCLAHLHCPPLSSALAAEVLISGGNQSMDSWDQSASATIVEEKMVRWLSDLFFKEDRADGVFTSGGTQSNLMGLLLARDRFLQQELNWNAQRNGLPIEASKLRILCSEAAHFTVRQSAFLLGLGEQAVIPVETDEHQRISIESLKHHLKLANEEGLLPFALVATAGTTDFGSIDPLNELARIADEHHMWFHVDAAYGGALMLSENHKHKLTGIDHADSITVDFHKLFYQPISCGAFLLKDRANFDSLKLHADYLNPEDDEEIGIPNLVTKSIQTTRRFDALKLFVSFQALGRKIFAEMIDYTIDLAKETASILDDDSQFELVTQPEINAVVFRYNPEEEKSEEGLNQINAFIRSHLLEEGQAILARTRVNESVYLKLTLLNPRTTIEDIHAIFNQIKQLVQVEAK
ncbi:aspartate aminotransferase family protein [Alkalihalophilus lindianensis]|uniref:Aspartate aminotransferase family protein n=1 Tax=Alkalihalophilus lindianensis TaxID=1630542 RepID=A0ABU3X4T8_9BACI|nr:aspartate aminotransferase family protein [Alkalihalophilus lindianensis]MDV2682916.1 aspartate aminotransferase family protein [Alkalihalophilus lindianensis]